MKKQKVTQKKIDEDAQEIYEHVIGLKDWAECQPTVKAFYRRFARWHIARLLKCDRCGRIDEERHWICPECFVAVNKM